MSPLQPEIEAHMGIDDSEFNLLFSARAITSIVLPFGLPFLIQYAGTQITTMLFVFSAVAGQWMLIYGLESKDYNMLFMSRLVFGLSDLIPILQ